ncbi:uncharacterized protein [Palaemon carinicauda]|uniref:uncharacterized protein n=1 Tax=Palaemon carinicauda TaxID=392227 RepID=UPI0035B5B478
MTSRKVLPLIMAMWLTHIAATDPDKIILRPTGSSPYCTYKQSSTLFCDFSLTTRPVYLVTSSRLRRATSPSSESIEIRNASVFHLPENSCFGDIKILNTKEVVVDDSYQKKTLSDECEMYRLSLANSSITDIPAKVTRLDVIRSNIERLVLPAGLKYALVSRSRVEFFNTTYPLNGTVSVNVSLTNISFVGKLKVKDNARFQLLSSLLSVSNVSEIVFEDNADIFMSRSKLVSSEPVVLSVEKDVSLTLEDCIGRVTIKQILKENTKGLRMNRKSSQWTNETSSESVLCQSIRKPNTFDMQKLYISLLLMLDFVLVFAIIYRVGKRKYNQGNGEYVANFMRFIKRKSNSESEFCKRQDETAKKAGEFEATSLVQAKNAATPQSKTSIVGGGDHSCNRSKDEKFYILELKDVACTPSPLNKQERESTVKKRKAIPNTYMNKTKPKCLF